MLTGKANKDLGVLGISAVFVPKGTVLKLGYFYAWSGAPRSDRYLQVQEGPYKNLLIDREDLDLAESENDNVVGS